MQDVFRINNPAHIAGKQILLLNDIIPIHATLEAGATEPLNSGAAKVSIAGIAFVE